MRGKVAKQLRKAAGGNEATYNFREHTVPVGFDPIQNRVLVATTFVAELEDSCTRKAYKQAKRNFKQGK